MLNEVALLKFLDEQAKGRNVSRTGGLIATAIYEGLAARVRAGEFDYKVTPEPDDFVMPWGDDWVRTSNEEETTDVQDHILDGRGGAVAGQDHPIAVPRTGE